MNRKIVTFTMSLLQSQFEVNRLVEEAEKLGVEVNRALYRELSFDLKGQAQGSARTFIRGEEVTPENTMGMWFRVAGTRSGKYTEGRNLAIRLLGGRTQGSDHTVFCVNHEGYLKWTRMGKIAQHGVFLEAGIPVVPTRIFYTKSQITSNKSQTTNFFGLGWPVIAKHEKGYQGKSVRKFEKQKELEEFVYKIQEKNVGMFLWQKYLPMKWDLRVIVLGGEAIGAMKRTARGSEFRSNFSLGGMVEKWELSEEEKVLAERVAKVCGLDYGGVDIMKDTEGNNYILEVNRQCQFQGFEKATGINVARKVVEMFMKRG